MSSRPQLTEVIQKGLRLDRAIRLVWTSAPGWATVNLVLVVAQGLWGEASATPGTRHGPPVADTRAPITYPADRCAL